ACSPRWCAASTAGPRARAYRPVPAWRHSARSMRGLAFRRAPPANKELRMGDETQAPRRAALVTGSSRGIGRAVVEELARAGFDVCVNCSGEKGLAAARDL